MKHFCDTPFVINVIYDTLINSLPLVVVIMFPFSGRPRFGRSSVAQFVLYCVKA